MVHRNIPTPDSREGEQAGRQTAAVADHRQNLEKRGLQVKAGAERDARDAVEEVREILVLHGVHECEKVGPRQGSQKPGHLILCLH